MEKEEVMKKVLLIIGVIILAWILIYIIKDVFFHKEPKMTSIIIGKTSNGSYNEVDVLQINYYKCMNNCSSIPCPQPNCPTPLWKNEKWREECDNLTGYELCLEPACSETCLGAFRDSLTKKAYGTVIPHENVTYMNGCVSNCTTTVRNVTINYGKMKLYSPLDSFYSYDCVHECLIKFI